LTSHAAPDGQAASEGRLAKAQLDAGGISPIQAVLRRKWTILCFALLCASAMAFYAKQLPSRYFSEVSVALDVRQLRVINAESLLTKELLDREQLRTEMEPLFSIGLARDVVRALSLNTNPDFCVRPPGWRLVALPQPPACHLAVDEAARLLLSRVTPRTDGLSYVVYIGVTAGSPELAAQIANAYGEAFVAERQRNLQEVGAKATKWLETDTGRLGRDVAEADAALARYKAAHDLAPLHGETLTSQTLVDMNSALTQVIEEIAQRRSAVAQLQSAAHAHTADSTNFPVGETPLLHELLAKAAAVEQQESRLRTQFGVLHPDYLAARSEEQRLAQQIDSEVAKATQSADIGLAALEHRRTELQAKVDRLKGQVGTQEQDDVQLDALRRDAESKRQIYQSVLSRRMELEAQNGIQQPDARIVGEALPPISSSEPHRTMMIVGAFLAACGLGSVIAFPVALLSAKFRDIGQIEDEVGLPMLGLFPRPPRATAPHDIVNARPGSPEAEMIVRILPRILRPADAPDGGRGRCLVVTSALPSEGKTSFALSLGRAAADLGISVVLVDGDLRRPSVTKLLGAPKTRKRASKALTTEQDAQDSTTTQVASTGPATRPAITADVQSRLGIMSLSSAAGDQPRFVCGQDIGVLFQSLAKVHDLVLIDAPPLLLLADALTLSTQADGVLLVVDWRATPRRAVASAVQLLDRQGANIIGAITSKVDLRRDRQAVSHYFYNDPKYFRRVKSKLAA
jgi:uncharacterized protein involved in exopolysaccharide biosynthesis/Mrp family chromosome partitioning ATPase